MPARLSISTTTYSKAYLAVAWKTRSELQDYERRGFGQFMYLTMCAHMEGVIEALIRNRLHSITHMVKWESLPPMQMKDGKHVQLYDLTPVYESLLNIVGEVKNESRNAPLAKLIQRYNMMFSLPIREVVGKDLYEDLQALAALRNLFAHGREFFLEFEDPFEAHASLDANPVQQATLRLHQAGIINNLKITGQNHPEFKSAFYSDDALLYFYRAVQQIHKILCGSVTFEPEAQLYRVPELPVLET